MYTFGAFGFSFWQVLKLLELNVIVCTVCRTLQPAVGFDWICYCSLSHLLAHLGIRVMMMAYLTLFSTTVVFASDLDSISCPR